MPSKTAAPFEIPYSLEADKPPSMEAASKPPAERVHKLLGEIGLSQLVAGEANEGKLIIVNSGAAAYKAMSGDATISKTGVLTIGEKKILRKMLEDKIVNGEKIDDKTITLAKLVEALGLTEGYLADGAVGSRKLKPDFTVLDSGGIEKKASGSYLTWERTPAVASVAIIQGFFKTRVEEGGTPKSSIGMRLYIDGVISPGEEVFYFQGGAEGDATTLVGVWQVALTAAKHKFELKAETAGTMVTARAKATCLIIAS